MLWREMIFPCLGRILWKASWPVCLVWIGAKISREKEQTGVGAGLLAGGSREDETKG